MKAKRAIWISITGGLTSFASMLLVVSSLVHAQTDFGFPEPVTLWVTRYSGNPFPEVIKSNENELFEAFIVTDARLSIRSLFYI